MGTIASVLQWTCTNCNLINPTECLKCLNCGNIRRILDDSDDVGNTARDKRRWVNSSNGKTVSGTAVTGGRNDVQQELLLGNGNGETHTNLETKNTATTTTVAATAAAASTAASNTTWKCIANRNNRSQKKLPGYVEINSNG